MSQFINIKKLTANALMTAIIAGGLVSTLNVETAFSVPGNGNGNGNGNSNSNDNEGGAGCSNNGHGNNAPVTYNWGSGKLTISHYDPSNPSGQQTTSLISALVAGTIGRAGNGNGSNAPMIQYVDGTSNPSYRMTLQQATNLVNNHPDWELRGNGSGTTIYECSGNDFDRDGINDAIEIGSDVYNPLDTDRDGIPDYADTDNNNAVTNRNPIACTVGDSITLTGTLRDFSDSHPDFERTPGVGGFRYGLDRGITTDTAGSDSKPHYAGGSFSTTNRANFDQWFRDVPGVNESMQLPITLTKNSAGIYRYENRSFFPVNGLLKGNEGRRHNYHFTYELHSQFTYRGGEILNFSGDDDVWVYINGKKVIDIGGVHGRSDGSVRIDDVAARLGLQRGQTYDFDFFFAERHTTESNFILETSIELLCDTDNDGISDLVEGGGDADGDGIPNYRDTDSDGNGVSDGEEGTQDSDGDGTADYQDLDNDGNGFADTEDSLDDGDGDGILDYQDTDDDNDGTNDRNDNDIDGDGISNTEENNPTLPQDFIFPNNGRPDDIDGDGIVNSVDPDTDGNGTNDVEENVGDYDEDGTPDSCVDNSDNDIDNDGVPNSLDTNDDGDDLTDLEEAEYRTNRINYPSSNSHNGCSYNDAPHSGIPDIYED